MPFNLNTIARVSHEIVQSYVKEIGQVETPWGMLDEANKNEAIAIAHFYILDPGATAQHYHKYWVENKMMDGFSYGYDGPEMEDADLLSSYSELPKEKQIKDALFRQTVHSLTNV